MCDTAPVVKTSNYKGKKSVVTLRKKIVLIMLKFNTFVISKKKRKRSPSNAQF